MTTAACVMLKFSERKRMQGMKDARAYLCVKGKGYFAPRTGIDAPGAQINAPLDHLRARGNGIEEAQARARHRKRRARQRTNVGEVSRQTAIQNGHP
jgi:hypothetical protein